MSNERLDGWKQQELPFNFAKEREFGPGFRRAALFEPAARAALADQENLDAGLSEGTLLKGFVSSNCEDLRRALQRGDGVPTKVG